MAPEDHGRITKLRGAGASGGSREFVAALGQIASLSERIVE
jgi:hypothetical protein